MENKKVFYKLMLVFLTVMIGVVSIEFFVRGHLRAISNSADLTAPFLQSRAWLKGINPYQQGLEKDLVPEASDSQSFNSGIYPPSASAVLSPLVLFDWYDFKIVWAVLSTFLFLCMLFVVVDLASFSFNDVRLYILIFFAIALAPFHTGIGIGQVSIPAITLCIISYWLYSKEMRVLSGVILAVSACLKPQIAIFFFLYYLLRKDKKVFFTALVTCFFIFFISEIPYMYNEDVFGS